MAFAEIITVGVPVKLKDGQSADHWQGVPPCRRIPFLHRTKKPQDKNTGASTIIIIIVIVVIIVIVIVVITITTATATAIIITTTITSPLLPPPHRQCAKTQPGAGFAFQTGPRIPTGYTCACKTAPMLTERERIIALVANGIAAYSILSERGELASKAGGTIYSFILEAVPPPYRSKITPEIIDEVFGTVASAHNS